MTTNAIPTPVEVKVRSAIATLEELRTRLEQGQSLDAQFNGQGRYVADAIANKWGTHSNACGARQSAIDAIQWFLGLAPGNGVDGPAILEQWGYTDGMEFLEIPESVKEWLPEV